MNLFPDLQKRYTQEQLSAREAQRLAEFIAWGPVIFQASRLMIKFGILDLLRDNADGMTEDEIVSALQESDFKLSRYAVKCLLEASLSIGIVLIDQVIQGLWVCLFLTIPLQACVDWMKAKGQIDCLAFLCKNFHLCKR